MTCDVDDSVGVLHSFHMWQTLFSLEGGGFTKSLRMG